MAVLFDGSEGLPPEHLPPAYARRLELALGRRPGAPHDRPRTARDLLEPLTAREMEVLCTVATGLTNREVARKIYVEPSTVKKHLEHIYGKLAVRNRTQAVARARELGLLY